MGGGGGRGRGGGGRREEGGGRREDGSRKRRWEEGCIYGYGSGVLRYGVRYGGVLQGEIECRFSVEV